MSMHVRARLAMAGPLIGIRLPARGRRPLLSGSSIKETTTPKLRYALASAVLLLSACADMPVAEQGPRGTMVRFKTAFNKQDAAGVANIFRADGKLLPAGKPMITGSENIRAYWQAAFNAGVSRIENTPIDITVVVTWPSRRAAMWPPSNTSRSLERTHWSGAGDRTMCGALRRTSGTTTSEAVFGDQPGFCRPMIWPAAAACCSHRTPASPHQPLRF